MDGAVPPKVKSVSYMVQMITPAAVSTKIISKGGLLAMRKLLLTSKIVSISKA